jgi:putative transcriptional regulator
MPGMFSGSITYICEHGEAGAMGLVINQPLDLTLRRSSITSTSRQRGLQDRRGPRRRPGAGRSRLRAASAIHRGSWDSHPARHGHACADHLPGHSRAIAAGDGPATSDRPGLRGLVRGPARGGDRQQQLAHAARRPPRSSSTRRSNSASARAAAILGIDMNLMTTRRPGTPDRCPASASPGACSPSTSACARSAWPWAISELATSEAAHGPARPGRPARLGEVARCSTSGSRSMSRRRPPEHGRLRQ